MSYSVIHPDKKRNFISRIKIKISKIIAQKFPLNFIRVRALKLMEFEVGNQVYIGPELMIASLISDKSCHLIIGDRVAIGPRVTLILSSDANWSKLMEIIQPVRGKIILRKDCWIGASVTILPNVEVGEGAIVGAGSVVTKNVPANTIVAGVPAKTLRKIKE